MVRKILLAGSGVAAACALLWLGNRVGALQLQDPENFNQLKQQIWQGGSVVSYSAAVLATIGTVVTIFGLLSKLAEPPAGSTRFIEGTGVFWSIVFLGISAFAIGALAQPLASADYPWPFVGHHHWRLRHLNPDWYAAAAAASVPLLLLLCSFVGEFFARLSGSYAGNKLLLDIKRWSTYSGEQLDPKRSGTALATLTENFQTHRNAFGKRMDNLEASLATLTADLEALKALIAAGPAELKEEIIKVFSAFRAEADIDEVEGVHLKLDTLGRQLNDLAARLPAATFLPPGLIHNGEVPPANNATAEQK